MGSRSKPHEPSLPRNIALKPPKEIVTCVPFSLTADLNCCVPRIAAAAAAAANTNTLVTCSATAPTRMDMGLETAEAAVAAGSAAASQVRVKAIAQGLARTDAPRKPLLPKRLRRLRQLRREGSVALYCVTPCDRSSFVGVFGGVLPKMRVVRRR